MKLTCVCVVLLLAAVRAGSVTLDKQQIQNQMDVGERARIFCGRYLADARMLFCYGIEELKAKSGISSSPLILSLHSDPVAAEAASLERHSLAERAYHVSSKRNTGEGSIVDECCLKPCLVSELLGHC